MKTLNSRHLYTLCFFLGCFCLFSKLAWSDGSLGNPYIDRVEIIQTDKQGSGEGIEQSTIVKVMLNSFNGSLKDRIVHVEMRDPNGVVYSFSDDNLYYSESGDFYFKQFPFFLADDEIEIIVYDNEKGKSSFYIKQPEYSIENTATYDGSWSGKTNQNYDVSFTVSNNEVSSFKIKQKISGSYCSATITMTISGGTFVSGEKFSISGSSPGTYGSTYSYKGTFANNTVCNGTWNYHDNYCNASGSGTWTANNGASPPSPTTTTTTSTTTTSTTTTTTLPTVPTAPTLSVSTSGTTVSLSWTSVAGAAGYTLYFAPYPYTGPESIGAIPMGIQTSMSASLSNGAAFYVAIQTYNGVGKSGYSNIEYFVLNTSVAASPIPETGQTKCYNNSEEIICPQPGQDFSGQDANYTINPLSYTKLDDKGDSLPTSATSWCMVKDNVTGLIWEVKTDDGSVHDKDNQYTWYDSNPATNGGSAGMPENGTDTEDFINALNAESFGGHKDWRLPTIKELDSIVNLGKYNPGIDTTFFPNTVSFGYYWSSSTNANDTGNAWDIVFNYPGVGWASKSSAGRVRAVRGGQAVSLGHLVTNGDGTVTDTYTGLMWQQAGIATEVTWEVALSYCESLSLAGYTDWRLPNRKELRSIVDYNVHSPATDTAFFPNTVSSGYYWSSSTNANDTGNSWSIGFLYGIDLLDAYKASVYHVRAVRGGHAQ